MTLLMRRLWFAGYESLGSGRRGGGGGGGAEEEEGGGGGGGGKRGEGEVMLRTSCLQVPPFPSARPARK